MPISFDFKPEPTAGLVPVGIHRFVVVHVEERNGSKGAYLNMRLAVYVQGVRWGAQVFEVLSTSPDSKFRVDQFFAAVGAPSEGKATAPWFLNKSGWAKFDHKENQNGVLQSRVTQYLNKDQAETLVAKQAQELDGISGGTNGASIRPAQSAAKVVSDPVSGAGAAPSPTKKRKAAITELDAEASPF